jgi:hypothetical protein
MSDKKQMECKFISGGTGEVCKWINDNGIADQVVSIVKREKDYEYLIFYTVETPY